MDLSALIFVALAVAWAVYLVPKALRHHEDVARSRSVDRFSHTLRVLARREPVSAKAARLVVHKKAAAPEKQAKADAPSEPPAELSPAQARARRAAAKRATKRRRIVLALILLANLIITVLVFGT